MILVSRLSVISLWILWIFCFLCNIFVPHNLKYKSIKSMFIGCVYLKTIGLAYIILKRKAKTLSCKFLPTKQFRPSTVLSAQQIKGCSAAAVKVRIISNKCQGWDEAGRYKERGKASPAALWTVFAWNPVSTTVSLFHRGFGQRAYRGEFDFVPSA